MTRAKEQEDFSEEMTPRPRGGGGGFPYRELLQDTKPSDDIFYFQSLKNV